MKAEILCLAVCFCCMIYQNEAHIRRFKNKVVSHSYPTYWFYQKLDHFNAADVRMWKQRYFVNETFFKSGGPVFLMIGGEGEANPVWMLQGQWIKYAQQYGALCVMLEHRYYGQSHPTEDLSVDNLRFLSSEQALADLASFRTFLATSRNLTDNKWIAFGGSYPGSLAAWFRLKYPHLVHAAVSSSAPLFAEINFKEYLQVVNDALSVNGSECVQNIASATAAIEKQISEQRDLSALRDAFKLCDDIDVNNQNDLSNLFTNLAGNFEGVVQYNKDNRKFEGARATDITLDTLCALMTESSVTDVVQRYANVNSLLLNAYDLKCLDFKYDKMVSDLSKTGWDESAAEGGRQWIYQTCTEFGYYQSSDFDKQPFGHQFPVNFSVQQCGDVFDKRFNTAFLNAAVQETNAQYGGFGLKVTQVVFVNGAVDPWHALGMISDLNPESPAIFIKGTAHCANMYPDSEDDPPQLVSARQQVSGLIGKWLAMAD